MTIRQRVNGWFKRSYPGPSTIITLPGGISVSTSSQDGFLYLSAVYNALVTISGAIASAPLNLYQRLPDGGRKKAVDHPYYKTFNSQANPFITSYQWIEAVVTNIETYNIAYSIVGDTGRNLELYPVKSKDVNPVKGGYKVTIGGTYKEVPDDMMLVIAGISYDGRNPIDIGKERLRSLGLYSAQEERAAKFNENGAAQTMAITLPPEYSHKDKVNEYREAFEQKYKGIANSGGTMTLPSGTSVQQLDFKPSDLQMIESRRFSIEEVARWFNLPPHKLKDLSHATFSNIEHLAIEYVQGSIIPRVKRIEQALNSVFFPDDDYFLEFNLSYLLRGDTATRTAYYSTSLQNGWMSRDEVRSLENMNPIGTSKGGDKYTIQLNMQELKDVSTDFSIRSETHPIKKRAIETRAQKAQERRKVTNRFAPQFGKVAAKLVLSEVKQIRQAVTDFLPEQPIKFTEFLRDFYGENQFTAQVKSGFLGLLSVYGDEMSAVVASEIASDKQDLEKFIDNYSASLGNRWAAGSRMQLDKLAGEENPDELVSQRLDEWEETKAGKYEMNEPIKAEGAFARQAMMLAGVLTLTSLTTGASSCPFCNSINGKTISIKSTFASPNEPLGDGAGNQIVPSSNLFHPPYHDGCDCIIVQGG